MTPEKYALKKLILPELKVNSIRQVSKNSFSYWYEKNTSWEVCRKCPTKSFSVHDHRIVVIKEQKIRNKHVSLIIKKRLVSKICG